MQPEIIELTVPARPELVRIVRLAMAGIGNLVSFDVEEIDDLKMAISEACGLFDASGPHPLTVRASIWPDRLEVRVSQHVSSLLPRLFPSDTSERGMGFLLMRHLVDEVESHSDASEMQIRLIRYRK